ncbi:hypothetical protein [Tropicimonas sp. IMCC34043]|uniref:hypothetical protein n=1 Tax=Tropicimonas sp. IMCC34043 TaxID=2248760 RepID=UPI000E240056|nr:hypothetical protein [Tropicimonas sp. IMCC34043]
MARTTAHPGQDPNYDRFLDATVVEDGRGTTATVLSMLCRLDIDPWGEAAGLARMQESQARRRLADMMSLFADASLPTTARDKVISRLLSFLPRHAALAPTPTPCPSR